MTDEQFSEQVHKISLALVTLIERVGTPEADAGKLITATLTQTLAQTLGPVAAIERLRDMADLMELQIMQDGASRH